MYAACEYTLWTTHRRGRWGWEEARGRRCGGGSHVCEPGHSTGERLGLGDAKDAGRLVLGPQTTDLPSHTKSQLRESNQKWRRGIHHYGGGERARFSGSVQNLRVRVRPVKKIPGPLAAVAFHMEGEDPLLQPEVRARTRDSKLSSRAYLWERLTF